MRGIMTQNIILNMTQSNDLASKQYWLKIRRWKFHNWIIQKMIFLALKFITNFRRFPLCDYCHCQRQNGPRALSLLTQFIALTQSKQNVKRLRNLGQTWVWFCLAEGKKYMFDKPMWKLWQIPQIALTNPYNKFNT